MEATSSLPSMLSATRGAARVSLYLSDSTAKEHLSHLLRQGGYSVDLRRCEQHQSTLIESAAMVVDICHGLFDGVSLIRSLYEANPKVPILAIISAVIEPRVVASFEAGACGCLIQADLDEHLVKAIQEAIAGGAPLSQCLVRIVVAHCRRKGIDLQNSKVIPALSARETEVMHDLVRGLTYDQIASSLRISVNTVRGFVRAIYGKLEVGSKTEAAARAAKLGLLRSTIRPPHT